ncbi:MAG: hypothetical protein H8D22_02885 [Candidatus Cloacimonetes bacterium]|nr:hypothetical protein [Candidatus Cloacimonadota bacterium]
MTETKEKAIKIIQRLPDECTLTDIMAELYFRYKVEQGLQDIDKGRIISHKEGRKRMTKWANSIGH